MALNTPFTVSVLIPLLLLIVYNTAKWLNSTRRPKNFPPGPPTILGLGNLHQMPQTMGFLKYKEWAKEYGPITGLKLGPTNAILINDALVLYELIVKRGASFNGRPQRYVAQKHVLPEAQHVHSLYMRSDYSKRFRTVSKPFFSGTGLANLAPMLQAGGMRLVFDLFETGNEKMADCIAQWSVLTPVAMLSGAPVQEFGKSWIHDYHASQVLFEDLLDPGTAPPVDIFPILRWVPSMFAEWKRKAPLARKLLLRTYGVMMAQAKKERRGDFQSLIPKLLRQAEDPTFPEDGRFSEKDIEFMMGGILDAAVDSSVVSVNTILLSLATHPEAQRKAQAELDRVWGDKAIPEKIDLERLPYLTACVNESIRWRPASAFNLPRETEHDEEILGMHIPKGTMVILNHWTINHDPEFYDQPEEYNPDRFIKDPFGAKKGVSQVGRKVVYGFGSGRRECPGKDFALLSIRLAFAQVLWAFDILPGETLHTDIEKGFSCSVMLRTKPFKLKFVPRRTKETLVEEVRKADIKLNELLGLA
ncbi:cytochrome P450 [Bisporella sp. PMI_857]|nr:cytochrome P450 [Bisporella sp. PMI_857]